MPFTFQIDHRANIVHAIGSGVISVEDDVAFYESLMAHTDHRPGMNFLFDLRAAEYLPDTRELEHFMGIVARYERKIGPCRKAYLVGSEVDFGILRQAFTMVLSQHTERAVFRTEKQARAWLAKQ